MSENKDQREELLEVALQPKQLEMFRSVTSSDINSQSLRLWDSLINAIFDDRRKVTRKLGKFLDSKNSTIKFEDYEINVNVNPARLGSAEDEKEFLPSKKEWGVLEALIKIGVEESSTRFFEGKETNNSYLTVETTYYRIRDLFKKVTGKNTISHKQVKDAIDIMTGATVTFKANSSEIRGSLIMTSDISNEEKESSRSFRVVFHPIISRIIANGGYREFNFQRAIISADLFTIFLYKKFVHNFKHAKKDSSSSYTFLMSSILKEYPSINEWGRERKKIERIKKSLDSLTGEVILRYEATPVFSTGPGQKKIVDCKFEVWNTEKFAKEQIQANIQAKENNQSLLMPPIKTDYDVPADYFQAYKEYKTRIEGKTKADIIKDIFQ